MPEPRHACVDKPFGRYWHWSRDILVRELGETAAARGRGWFHTGLHRPAEGRRTVDAIREALRGTPTDDGAQVFHRLVFFAQPSQYLCQPPTITHVEIVPTDGHANVCEFVVAEYADA